MKQAIWPFVGDRQLSIVKDKESRTSAGKISQVSAGDSTKDFLIRRSVKQSAKNRKYIRIKQSAKCWR